MLLWPRGCAGCCQREEMPPEALEHQCGTFRLPVPAARLLQSCSPPTGPTPPESCCSPPSIRMWTKEDARAPVPLPENVLKLAVLAWQQGWQSASHAAFGATACTQGNWEQLWGTELHGHGAAVP